MGAPTAMAGPSLAADLAPPSPGTLSSAWEPGRTPSPGPPLQGRVGVLQPSSTSLQEQDAPRCQVLLPCFPCLSFPLVKEEPSGWQVLDLSSCWC